MLSCYRVLDLTDGKGYLCGKVLGELGADVIKIEPPGGDPDRDIGPFYHDQINREKSLYWFSYNANKRGITLNIETEDGREIFKKLVRTADAVIESFKPGYMEQIGLGYSVLSEINPGIVMTSISPFGQEGPYRDYKAPDIVLRALGGLIFTVGEPDRPPLTTSNEHSCHVGALHGAIGTVVALYQRSFTGRGQTVDAPIQQGLVFVGSTEQQLPWILQRQIPQRQGRERFAVQLNDGTTYLTPILWPCKDGDVSFTLASAAMAASAPAIIENMKKDGIDAGALERWDWTKVHEGEFTKADIDAILDTLRKYFSRHTKAELLQLSLDRGIHMGICLNVEEALKFPQFVSRGFWQEIEHPDLNTKIVYPSNFIKFSDAKSEIRMRAPLIGEHNAEILGKELGISSAELVTLKQGHVI
jgi:crotonobetainyl-CoA:carnitine CoA-transferase CaiB-like acyl-CoA transferase